MPAGTPWTPTLLRGLAVALVLALAPAGSRADNLDLKLVESGSGRRLLEDCRERGYKNVGTLKFRVKLPGGSLGFGVEPLCSNLADRLENLLILANDPDRLVGVLHDAGEAAAARDAKVSYRTPEGCKQLFKYTYPLAWGTARADKVLPPEKVTPMRSTPAR